MFLRPRIFQWEDFYANDRRPQWKEYIRDDEREIERLRSQLSDDDKNITKSRIKRGKTLEAERRRKSVSPDIPLTEAYQHVLGLSPRDARQTMQSRSESFSPTSSPMNSRHASFGSDDDYEDDQVFTPRRRQSSVRPAPRRPIPQKAFVSKIPELTDIQKALLSLPQREAREEAIKKEKEDYESEKHKREQQIEQQKADEWMKKKKEKRGHGKKKIGWLQFVKEFRAKNPNMSYREALSKAAGPYKKL